ncbi:lipase/serine esterase [Histoplasma ohiense]|nr:lipase/serine esterase [Histoplasma ohiense (nom. inval.)]
MPRVTLRVHRQPAVPPLPRQTIGFLLHQPRRPQQPPYHHLHPLRHPPSHPLLHHPAQTPPRYPPPPRTPGLLHPRHLLRRHNRPPHANYFPSARPARDRTDHHSPGWRWRAG